ncbi:hypothetical protein Agub_g14312, partial [Astrephomene gubernaculifera]
DFFELGAATLLANACGCRVCNKPIMEAERLWVCKTCCFEYAAMTDEQRKRNPQHWVSVCTTCAGQGDVPCDFDHEHTMYLIRNEWPVPLDKWSFLVTENVESCVCCGETHNFVPSYLRSDDKP